MKLTRNYAISAYRTLGSMALGHLDDTTLEIAIANFNALRAVADDFDSLKKELFKRIYGDVETMSDDERKKLQDFFDMLGKIEKAKGEEYVELDKVCKATYPDIYDMRVREVKVLASLLNKEVEVEIEPMDADAFCKGVVKGKKDTPIAEIRAFFAPMFKEEEKKDADFSELDAILKD